MSDALAIAASGLGAASGALSITAQNLANLNTANYHPEEPVMTDLAGGGVAIASIQTSPTAGVDEAAQMVDLRREKLMYDANAAVIRTSQKMFGSLLDIFDTDGRR